MNSDQRRDWLAVASECLPDWRLAPLRELLDGLDAAAPGALWEGGICGRPEAKTLAVRCFGGAGDLDARRRAAAGVLRCALDDGAAPPAHGLPWLSIEWDASEGVPARATFTTGDIGAVFRGGETKPSRVRFSSSACSPRAMEDEALARVLTEFEALCPIRDLVFRLEADAARTRSPAWSLRLKEPLPWPLFARLDMAAAFAAESTRWAFFLLERRVTELMFDESTLWAYFRE